MSEYIKDLKKEQQKRAGCRVLRRTRQGIMVGLYKASETDLDAEAGAWALICETHSGICYFDTREKAQSYFSYPNDWCPDCQENGEGLNEEPVYG